MHLLIYDNKFLEKYKTILAKIEDLKNIELNALSVYNDRYIKTKIRTYSDKVYTNFRGLNVLEYDLKCKSSIRIASFFYLLMRTHILCEYI